MKRDAVGFGQSLGTLASVRGAGAGEVPCTARTGKSKGRAKTIKLSNKQMEALKTKRTLITQQSQQQDLNSQYTGNISSQKFTTRFQQADSDQEEEDYQQMKKDSETTDQDEQPSQQAPKNILSRRIAVKTDYSDQG